MCNVSKLADLRTTLEAASQSVDAVATKIMGMAADGTMCHEVGMTLLSDISKSYTKLIAVAARITGRIAVEHIDANDDDIVKIGERAAAIYSIELMKQHSIKQAQQLGVSQNIVDETLQQADKMLAQKLTQIGNVAAGSASAMLDSRSMDEMGPFDITLN